MSVQYFDASIGPTTMIEKGEQAARTVVRHGRIDENVVSMDAYTVRFLILLGL
jgi:hypothetical protein